MGVTSTGETGTELATALAAAISWTAEVPTSSASFCGMASILVTSLNRNSRRALSTRILSPGDGGEEEVAVGARS